MIKISVVIPCRNEKSYIEECVSAILSSRLEAACELQVYVVDGMSDDGTREVINSLCAQHDNVHLVDNTLKLTPYAFNLGIKAGGQCDYVQIVGARHILSDNYIAECVQRLQNDPSIWCVGGKIINEFVNEPGKIIAEAMSTSFGMGLGNFRTLEKSGFTDTVTSPMYPSWVFAKIGFFDENLVRNQDDDYNFRVLQAGGKIYFDANISLKYYVRAAFSGLRKQFFQYGYWKVFVNRKHKAVTTFRQLIPPLFVAYLALFGFSFLISLTVGLIFSLPFELYLALLFLVSLKQSKGKDFWSFMLVFPMMHISYGLGYLLGIFHFLILGRDPSGKQKELSR
ncbi:MAG: hypothetical protein K0R65_2163 [Crocinitomicaceae bacterium]|jgi:glycosyltransferase involved in cell wall biosynthesis|nr:hypothetical protein [Crocinitomicaceae bacterium]